MKTILKKKLTTRLFAVLLTAVMFLSLAAACPVIPVASASGTMVDAYISNHDIWINGWEADIRGYLIEGQNFVLLRDVAKALDIHIDWEASTNTVVIDTMQPYSGSASAVPTLVQHTRTSMRFQLIRINGRERLIEAYSINDNNYIRLRSATFILDIGVTFDETTGRVNINTVSGSENGGMKRETVNPILFPRVRQPVAPVREVLTEQIVYDRIMAMREVYPDGWRPSGNPNVGGWCTSYSTWITNAVFGERAPNQRYTDVSQIKVGDIARINNDTHDVVILTLTNTHVVVTEGNYGGQVHWGRTFTREHFRSIFSYGHTFWDGMHPLG